MTLTAMDKILEKEWLPVQEFLFNSKDLLVGDQLFYEMGKNMLRQEWKEEYLSTYKTQKVVRGTDHNGMEDFHVEINFLTLNPKQLYNLKTLLQSPPSEKFFESEVTQVSFLKEGTDFEGNLRREHPLRGYRGHVNQNMLSFKIMMQDQTWIQTFAHFLCVEAIRKEVRDALYNGTLIAYSDHDNSLYKIAPHQWIEDDVWFQFLADGCIPCDQYRSRRIFFKKEDVNASIFLEELKSWSLQSPLLELLVKVPEKQKIFLSFQEPEKEQGKKRAALIVFDLCRQKIETVGIEAFQGNRGIERAVEDIVKEQGFEIPDHIQKRLYDLEDEEKEKLENTAVSKADIFSIKTLLRSLKQQGRSSLKKP